MKSVEEIQEILIEEIKLNRENIIDSSEMDYYNETLGDVSFLLAGYLHAQLKKNYEGWDASRWIDDSLITKIDLKANKISIWGVMIWGIQNDTKQWTEPFYFNIALNENNDEFVKSTILFSDSDCSEITYEEFNNNRNYWDRNYYSNEDWHPFEREWKYIINSNNERLKLDS